MKHVVCAASPGPAPLRRCILVTGFGAFPGAPINPSAAILQQLARQTARLGRCGIELRCLLLPVVYDEVGPALRAACDVHRPEALLHLGLAGRRRTVSIETRAINRAGLLHPDASGQRPRQRILVPDAPPSLAATYPAVEIRDAVRRCGLAARLSVDAGDYVCNATLFASLAGRMAPQIGFIHVPPTRQMEAKARAGRPTVESLTRAVIAAVIVMARRRPVSSDPADAPKAHAPDVASGTRSPP